MQEDGNLIILIYHTSTEKKTWYYSVSKKNKKILNFYRGIERGLGKYILSLNHNHIHVNNYKNNKKEIGSFFPGYYGKHSFYFK